MKKITSARLKFGPKIKTTFIDSNQQSAVSIYDFEAGPESTAECTNDDNSAKEIWVLRFHELAPVNFGGNLFSFDSATVIKYGDFCEMFITSLYFNAFKNQSVLSIRSFY